MPVRLPAQSILLASLGLLLLGGVGCTTPASAGGKLGPDFPVLAQLTGPERAQVVGAAEALPCPCGGARTLDSCAAAECPRGERLVRIAAGLARLGASTTDILGEMNAYEVARASCAPVALAEAPCKGPEGAAVTLVAFSDFECPSCANLPLLVDSLLERLGGKARFCFKHFPLSSHPRAGAAAQAAEFARRRGRFWPMHDALFEQQYALQNADLAERARAIGLDGAELERALGSDALLAPVLASREEGERLGVEGTPTLFINGCRLSLPPTPEIVELAIEDELERRQGAGN